MPQKPEGENRRCVSFLFCSVKQKGLNFNPEVVSNAAKQRVRQVSQLRRSRNMREKLIRGSGGGDVFGDTPDTVTSSTAGIPGLQAASSGNNSPAVAGVASRDNNARALNQVTVELNHDPLPGTEGGSGAAPLGKNTDSPATSYGDLSIVSEAASEPSTPHAHSSNDIRLQEVRAKVV